MRHRSARLNPAYTIQIVNKDSGVTNLFNEAKCSMAVDHHAICKFRHKEDQGYKYIKNTLIDLAMPLLQRGEYSEV